MKTNNRYVMYYVCEQNDFATESYSEVEAHEESTGHSCFGQVENRPKDT